MKLSAVPFAALDALTSYGLWKLRQDVFVVEQHCPYNDLDGRDLAPETRHVILEDDHGVVLGCARVLDDGHSWRIGRVALHPTIRGRGFAEEVIRAALAVCPDRDVVLDAQSPLAGLYGSLGFVVAGEEFLEDGIAHLPMWKPVDPSAKR